MTFSHILKGLTKSATGIPTAVLGCTVSLFLSSQNPRTAPELTGIFSYICVHDVVAPQAETTKTFFTFALYYIVCFGFFLFWTVLHISLQTIAAPLRKCKEVKVLMPAEHGVHSYFHQGLSTGMKGSDE